MTKHQKGKVQLLLEHDTLKGMLKAKQLTDKLLKYHWKYYSELAQQRNEIQEQLHKALIQSCRSNYEFKQWQRAVKYKFGLHPLATVGSLRFIGGRFNTGFEVNSQIPSFPALYLAQDKDTALQEHLGQQSNNSNYGLTPRERALTNPSSETIVSVGGRLDKVFDLTVAESLNSFTDLIKKFTLSKELQLLAKKFKVPNPGIIKTPRLLQQNLLTPNWREWPDNYDIPANSQIFGHLIYSAKIEGILYQSKFTNMLCLSIFPHNFPKTDSFIRIDDDVPDEKVPNLIDAINGRLCDLDFNEILSFHTTIPNDSRVH